MTLWLDNQLPPALGMRTTLSVDCITVRDLKLQRASDLEIFHAARDARVVVMTKDSATAGYAVGELEPRGEEVTPPRRDDGREIH